MLSPRLHNFLDEHHGHYTALSHDRTITADAATPEEAALLDTTPGAPVLKINRRIVSADGRPLETCCSTYRGDRFRYRLPTTREFP